MNPELNFWRLLGDYEGLTRDETTAIREWHFDALAEIHDKKLLILDELVRIDGRLALNRANPALRNRLTLLGEAEERNARLVNDGIAAARREFKVLQAASVRLRAIDQVYTTNTSGGSLKGSFCVQG